MHAQDPNQQKAFYPSIPTTFGTMPAIEQMFSKLVRMLPDSTERNIALVIMEHKDNPHYRKVYADYLEKMGRDEEADAERLVAQQLEENERQRARAEWEQPKVGGGIVCSGVILSGTIGSSVMIGGSWLASGTVLCGSICMTPVKSFMS